MKLFFFCPHNASRLKRQLPDGFCQGKNTTLKRKPRVNWGRKKKITLQTFYKAITAWHNPTLLNQPSPKDFFQATLCWALRGWLDSMFWCFRALKASVLWSLIASRPPLCGENEVEVGDSGLSKARSHRSQSEALTPSRYLMDFRRLRQTHSWAPNKLIRAPQICAPHISQRTHPLGYRRYTLFLYYDRLSGPKNWIDFHFFFFLHFRGSREC